MCICESKDYSLLLVKLSLLVIYRVVTLFIYFILIANSAVKIVTYNEIGFICNYVFIYSYGLTITFYICLAYELAIYNHLKKSIEHNIYI